MDIINYQSLKTPYIITCDLSISDFDDYINNYRKNDNGFVAILRGKRMQSFNDLFNEIAAVFQFPWYFGMNWNALNECIKDLSWLNKSYYLIGIDESSKILVEEQEDDKEAFMNLLNETCKWFSKEFDIDKKWGRLEKPFHFVIQKSNTSLAN